ncbi:MAG: hypothetical protein AB7S81_05145, partial [Bdellovibrionales bacterium]
MRDVLGELVEALVESFSGNKKKAVGGVSKNKQISSAQGQKNQTTPIIATQATSALEEIETTSSDNNEDSSQDDVAADKIKFSGEVLTAEGGGLNIPAESRNLCALFSDGTWLVSSSHRHSPLVTSVSQMARRHGFVVNDPCYVT